MTTRPVLSILVQLWDIDAQRAKLVRELRAAVSRDMIDHEIETDPELRAIFEPAERLRAAVLIAEMKDPK